MSPLTRTWISAALGTLAFVLYAADLLGVKPPPRILPSVALAIAAVVIGMTPSGATATPAREPGPPTGTPHPPATAGGRGRPSRDRALVIIGFLLHALLLVPVVPIGLIAPGLGIITVHGIWLAGFIVAWRARRSSPPVVLIVPFVATALIAATVWFGTTVLGWQP